jgi:hypothetical protein
MARQGPSKREQKIERDSSIFEHVRTAVTEERDRRDLKLTRSVSLAHARDVLYLEQVEAICKSVFKGKMNPSGYALQKSKTAVERHLHLVLSDLHFHSLLDSRVVPYKYGPVEEARRLAQVVKTTAEYKLQYRKETTLNLALIGDIIQNQLHDKRDGAPLSEQVAAAIWLLTQAISFLSTHFPKVVVRCTPGNHGRMLERHQDRATLSKWDSIENMIYFALKMSCANLKNVTFDIPYKPFIEYSVFGYHFFGTHGDTVLKVGYPGSRIDVAAVEKEVNRINAASLHQHGWKYDVFFIGHVHIGTAIRLQNRSKVFTNGALIPPDEFSGSMGAFEADCGQTIWESVKGHPVGDYRFIEVSDDRQGLDKKPFKF